MVFKYGQLEKKFQRDGYLVLPFLNSQEVSNLQEFFNTHYIVALSGFHSTHFLGDRDLKRKVHDQIVAVFNPKLEAYLADYRALFANFMVKSIGENSRMPLHADWTYVDESAFQSLGIWCPLIDTNKMNGMLGVVPYSHLLKTNKRGPQIPSSFNDFNQYIIDNYGKLLPLKAGEVVIYDHRTLHFSPPNLSNNLRIAINLVATPTQAQLFHYASFGLANEIECFAPQDSDFFMKYEHFQKPDNNEEGVKMLQEIKFLSKAEIDQVLAKRGTSILEKCLNFLRG